MTGNDTKYMTDQEMWDYDEYHLNLQLVNMEKKYLKEQIRSEELKKQISDLQKTILSTKYSEAEGRIVALKEAQRKRKDVICERFGIKSGKFVFDPDTGEIDPID